MQSWITLKVLAIEAMNVVEGSTCSVESPMALPARDRVCRLWWAARLLHRAFQMAPGKFCICMKPHQVSLKQEAEWLVHS